MNAPGSSKPPADLLLDNIATLVTCMPSGSDPIGRIQEAALAISGNRILALGTREEVVNRVNWDRAKVIDCTRKIVAPGFVDCHTHLVFGGTRVQEYSARLTHSAEEVRAMGIPGGILATVEMTRREPIDMLAENASKRLDEMLVHGTTTVESKSGYGLDLEAEIKILEVNRRLHSSHPVDLISTFLGAHAIPPEIDHARYVDLIVSEMIPTVASHGLAEFCDVYCDEGYFTVDDSHRILEAARQEGFKLKIHTDQYSKLGGADLAAELQVISADHLNFTGRESAGRLSSAGVTGVLMPLIDFAVSHPKPAPARMLIEEGLPIALATDFCPGGWVVSMPLVIQFASRQYGLSPAESFFAATAGSSRALNLSDRGVVSQGSLADIQIWDLPSFEDAFYRLGHNPVQMVIKGGRVVVVDGVVRGLAGEK